MSALANSSYSVLTPSGRAAIATIAVWGSSSWQLLRACFHAAGAALPDMPEAGRFWFGRIGTKERGFDEVVLAVKRAAPTPCLEIHCHGGPEVVNMLGAIFAQCGARECSWQAFIASTAEEKVQAQAAIALAQAATLRTAGILLDQYHGAFAIAVERCAALLRGGEHPEAATALAELARHTSLGRHLTTPWRVVIAGAPNVGKSSLVNALAGFQRSIVSPVPGTTRDLVTTALAIDGWPIELIDTAGARAADEPLEHEGIVRAERAAAEADLCLWLVEASAEPILPAPAVVARRNVELVINKIDLPPVWDIDQVDATRISAQTLAGVTELCEVISNRLVPEPPTSGKAVPFTPEYCELIERAQSSCAAGQFAEALATLEQSVQSVRLA